MTLYLCHINIRSLLANFSDFIDHINDCDYDIIGLSETWLRNNIDNAQIHINNFNFIRLDRINGRGGGVGIFIKQNINFEILYSACLDFVEYIWIKFKVQNKVVILGNIYRPPSADLNLFLNHIEDTIINIYAEYDNIICFGDFNINLLESTRWGEQLESIMDTFNLKQLVLEPTRLSIHSATLIDLIFTNMKEEVVQSGVHNIQISDHFPVYLKMQLSPERQQGAVQFNCTMHIFAIK